MADDQNSKARSEAAGLTAAAVRTPEPGQESEAQAAVNYEEVARLAYAYWQARGCPEGSPLDDWLRAEAELRGQVRQLHAHAA
jgi:hypothetical protein